MCFCVPDGYPDISDLIWIFASWAPELRPQASRYLNSFPSPRWIQTISWFSIGKWWFCLNTGYLKNPIKSRVSRVFSLKKTINWVSKITPWPPVQACAGCPPEVLKAGDRCGRSFLGVWLWLAMYESHSPGYRTSWIWAPKNSTIYIYM